MPPIPGVSAAEASARALAGELWNLKKGQWGASAASWYTKGLAGSSMLAATAWGAEYAIPRAMGDDSPGMPVSTIPVLGLGALGAFNMLSQSKSKPWTKPTAQAAGAASPFAGGVEPVVSSATSSAKPKGWEPNWLDKEVAAQRTRNKAEFKARGGMWGAVKREINAASRVTRTVSEKMGLSAAGLVRPNWAPRGGGYMSAGNAAGKTWAPLFGGAKFSMNPADSKVLGAGKRVGGAIARTAARHPGVAMGMAVLGVGAVMAAKATAKTAGGIMDHSEMITSYNKSQYAQAMSQRPQGDQYIAPTWSGNSGSRRRVRGGHMGATGDLTFAMHNRRHG